MKYIKVAGACVNQTPLDWDGNRNHIISCIHEAKKNKVAMLCLPELAICGYGCEDTFFSGYVTEESLKSLKLIAAECSGIIVSVGLPIQFENCLYNTTCLIQHGEILGFVAKQQLAGDGVHYEPRWFKRWPKDRVAEYNFLGKNYPLGDLIFEFDGIRVGFEICEDAWTGLRPAQDHYINNVDIIFSPSASHFAFGKTKIREKLVSEASRSYSCAYVYSNLLGNESGRIIYDGEILIAQGGELLAGNKKFSFQDWQIVSAVLDIEAIRRQRLKSYNFEPNIQPVVIRGIEGIAEAPDLGREQGKIFVPETHSKEEEFLKALCLGLFDYMRKSRSRGFMISLSGGADSTACAVVSVFALKNAFAELGQKKFAERLAYLGEIRESEMIGLLLTCVYQGTKNSSSVTLNAAKAVAEELGADFHNWEVQVFFDQYVSMVEKSLGRKLEWNTDDIALQNIQARLRSPGIWMMANVRNALLLATSNRSEAAVGYATMDGDTSGGLAPLAGIDKTFLLSWLKWAEKNLGLGSLKFVNELIPTAELRPAGELQTDEKDLMPYSILNQIEKCAIRDYKSPLEVFISLRGIAEDQSLKLYIRRFFTLWARNQWKRERYAPSFHLDDENLDPKTWCRFPILSGGYGKALDEMDQY